MPGYSQDWKIKIRNDSHKVRIERIRALKSNESTFKIRTSTQIQVMCVNQKHTQAHERPRALTRSTLKEITCRGMTGSQTIHQRFLLGSRERFTLQIADWEPACLPGSFSWTTKKEGWNIHQRSKRHLKEDNQNRHHTTLDLKRRQTSKQTQRTPEPKPKNKGSGGQSIEQGI